jgi:hypothetical protein
VGPLSLQYGASFRCRWRCPPDMEGNCKYIISSHGQPTRGGPPPWGLGVTLTTPHHKKLAHYERSQLGPGWIPWINDISERKLIWDLVLGMWEVCIGQVHSGQWWKKSQNISYIWFGHLRSDGTGGKRNDNHELSASFLYIKESYQ